MVFSDYCTGMIGSISYITIPSLALSPPELAVRQWNTAFDIGKVTAPPLALTSAACFGYLVYATRHAVSQSHAMGIRSPMVLYAVATVAIPSIVPYTIAIMNPTNVRLIALAREAEVKGKGNEIGATEGEVQKLLTKWAGMNYVRAVVVGTGAVLGAVASLAA